MRKCEMENGKWRALKSQQQSKVSHWHHRVHIKDNGTKQNK